MASIVAELNREWAWLSRTRKARGEVLRWTAWYPVLLGARDPQDVVARCQQRDDRAPAMLRALVELAAIEELAARTLLQALLPGIVRFSRWNWNDPDATDEMVALAWERIRTYPLTRQGSVAANVLWDARGRYWRQRPRREISSEMHEENMPGLAPSRSAEDTAIDRLPLAQLARACREGIISRSEYELIVSTRLEGVPVTELATAYAVSRRTLYERRRQAEVRLNESDAIDRPAA